MTKPGFLLVLGHSLDMEKMARYSEALPPIYSKYGGYYLGIGGPGRGVELLEGSWFNHSLVLAQFPSKDAVITFWNSPEYTDAKQLRRGGGEFNVFAMEGTGIPVPDGEPAFLISVFKVLDTDAFMPIADAERARMVSSEVPYLVRAAYNETERLEGDLLDFDFTVAAFPTQAAATANWNAPEMQEIRRKRAEVAAFNTFLVRGLRRSG